MNASERMPVLFIGHGSPMNVVLDNAYTRSLVALAKSLPRPASILVVSAHWLTEGTFVTCADRPRQIYDFYGFPDELYRVRYEPAGAPAEARSLCQSAGPVADIQCDGGQGDSDERGDRAAGKGGASSPWGLDHASWAVLRHMYPDAEVPVWEMSLVVTKPPIAHYELARVLAPLRERGVLIIGSGNLVHNLRLVDFDQNAKPFSWAMEADEWCTTKLLARDHDALIRYERAGRAVAMAVPTNDHYLPMLYSLGLRGDSEQLTFTHEGIQNGSVSMRCFRTG